AAVSDDGSSRGAEPLPVGRCSARCAHACDLLVLLVLLELLTFGRVCLPAGGGPHAALQELPLEPAAHRADALLAAFPCGASHAGRLLYVLRTGAAFDPRAALRLTDWGNVARVLRQLLALAAPPLYERTRHGLFGIAAAATLLASITTALWTVDALLLPLVASALAARRGLSAAYFGCKAATMLRFHVGILTCLNFIEAALPVLAMAVLPCLVLRIRERVRLRPQNRAYLISCGVAGGGGGGGEATRQAAVGGSNHMPQEPPSPSQPRQTRQQPWPRIASTLGVGCQSRAAIADDGEDSAVRSSMRPGSPTKRPQAAAAFINGGGCCASRGGDSPVAAAQGVLAASPTTARGGNTGPVGLVSAPPPPLRSSVRYRPSTLYKGGRAVSRGTAFLSVKVPLPQVEDHTARHRQHQEAAAAVMEAAGSALRPYLDQATPVGALAAGADGVSGIGIGGTERARAAAGDAAQGLWQLARPASAVCVEGCVHLLLMARWVKWGGDSWGGAGGGGEVGGSSAQHATLQQAGAEEATGVDCAALDVTLKRLLMAALPHDIPQRLHGAFVWPPAVPLAAAVGPVEQRAGAGRADGITRAPQQQLGTRGTEVLVLLPAALLEGQGAVHLDVTVGAAAGGWQPAAESRPGGGGYLQLRLGLPPAALRDAGALLLHLLPPPAGAGGAPAEGPDVLTGQPFATLPLLVLPSAAAEEVLQLYGDPLGGGWVRDTLDGLLGTATTAAADGGACCELLAGGGMDAAAASAAADIAVSGLTSLSYDLGDLMQLPYGGAGMAAAPPDPVVVLDRHLLSFLASHGMAACLRVGLQALRCVGVQLAEKEEAALLAEAEAGGGPVEGGAEAEGGAGLDREEWAGRRPLAAAAEDKNAATSSGAEQGELQRASAVTPAVCDSPAGARKEGAPDADGATAPAGGRTVQQRQQLPPGQPAGPLWWLRVLLLGFSPPALERSYQAFKAAQCRTLDCTALWLLVAVRLSVTSRTLRAMRADAAAPRAAEELGAWRLSPLQQQLLAELAYASSALVPAAIAVCTSLLHRRRNALLLLRVVLDAVALSCILMPASWIGRQMPMLLRVSAAWTDYCRRRGTHWLFNSMLVPAALQLSPRQQSWAVLISLLPMTLKGYHVNYNRWGPALAFGVGNALCGMAIAAITDLPTRRRFVRLQRSSGGCGGCSRDGDRPLQGGCQGGGDDDPRE
ncbi:hypothetical protein TSOC_003223, partial [Tetrabaena socialis]